MATDAESTAATAAGEPVAAAVAVAVAVAVVVDRWACKAGMASRMGIPNSCHTSISPAVSRAIIASVCNGVGVNRSRSLPRGTCTRPQS